MENNAPLVSIAVITYDQEDTLPQTLDCILNQNIDFPIEIIIGEDCSKDRTREICLTYKEKYPDIIRLILHEINQGLLKNYKSVIELCSGKYITGCAGDDYWHNPDKLRIQVDFLETHPDYGLVHSDVNVLIMKTGTMRTMLRESVPTGNVYQSLLLNGNYIYALTVMFRKELLQYVNIDDFIKNDFLMEDYPMWLEFSNHTKFHWIDKPLATYRQNVNSTSTSKNYGRLAKFLYSKAKIIKYYYMKYPDKSMEKKIKKSLRKQLFYVFELYCKYIISMQFLISK